MSLSMISPSVVLVYIHILLLFIQPVVLDVGELGKN